MIHAVVKLGQSQKQNFEVLFLIQLKAHYPCLSALPCTHSPLCFAFSDTSDWISELAGEICGDHMVAGTLNYKVKCEKLFLFGVEATVLK